MKAEMLARDPSEWVHMSYVFMKLMVSFPKGVARIHLSRLVGTTALCTMWDLVLFPILTSYRIGEEGRRGETLPRSPNAHCYDNSAYRPPENVYIFKKTFLYITNTLVASGLS